MYILTKSSQFDILYLMKALSIYEAKTNFSKLVEKAKKGSIIYVGAFGKPEVMIMPVPTKKPVKFGVLANKLNYDEQHFVGLDKDVQKLFYGE